MKELAIMASGMVTAIGFNSAATCAAIRARISGIEELYLTEYIGCSRYLRGGKVALPHWWDSLDKLANLIAPAIYECLLKIPTKLHHQIPILLGVPLKETQFLGDCVAGELLAKVEAKLGLPHHNDSQLIPHGHTSGIRGLVMASNLLLQDDIPFCIVAGTDSYLQRKTVDHYLAQQRILTQSNSNGFLPAEAGSAILVAEGEQYPDATLFILGIGETSEPVTISSEEPFMAKGMTSAIREAVNQSDISLDKIKCRFTDINGEYYKFNEGTLALGRFGGKGIEIDMDTVHPMEYTGEIGAAIVPLLLGLALNLREKNCHPSKYLLFHVGNDLEDRGVLITRYDQ